MRPSIGRTVHYVSRGSADGRFPKACRAATITDVRAVPFGTHVEVTLFIMNPGGTFHDAAVPYHEGVDIEGEGSPPTGLCEGKDYGPGTWHWPARVD